MFIFLGFLVAAITMVHIWAIVTMALLRVVGSMVLRAVVSMGLYGPYDPWGSSGP